MHSSPKFWTKVYFGDDYDFNELFAPKRYKATCDFPSCYFWKEQLQRYPNAKVILTVRDPESWYSSCKDTIFRLIPGHPETPLGLKISRFFRWGYFGGFIELSNLLKAEALFENQIGKDACVKHFADHNQRVITECPKDKLLVFDISEGWEPLCRFLDKPIPPIPFPHVNDTEEFLSYLNFFDKLGYVVLAALVAAAALVIGWLVSIHLQ
jgi:hypothetical protein